MENAEGVWPSQKGSDSEVPLLQLGHHRVDLVVGDGLEA